MKLEPLRLLEGFGIGRCPPRSNLERTGVCRKWWWQTHCRDLKWVKKTKSDFVFCSYCRQSQSCILPTENYLRPLPLVLLTESEFLYYIQREGHQFYPIGPTFGTAVTDCAPRRICIAEPGGAWGWGWPKGLDSLGRPQLPNFWKPDLLGHFPHPSSGLCSWRKYFCHYPKYTCT